MEDLVSALTNPNAYGRQAELQRLRERGGAARM